MIFLVLYILLVVIMCMFLSEGWVFYDIIFLKKWSLVLYFFVWRRWVYMFVFGLMNLVFFLYRVIVVGEGVNVGNCL